MFKYLQDVLLHRLWRETSINKSEPKKSRGNRFDVTKGKISINPKVLAPTGNERRDFENSKEIVKLKRTYSLLMKKFVNPNLDLTPAGIKPFEQVKFQNFKRKYEMLKSTFNSVLDQKSTRKLPPLLLPDKSDSSKHKISETPEEISFGWSGQVLDRQAGIAKIELPSRPKDIASAFASYPEMEEMTVNKSNQSNNGIKRNFKSISQRKQKKLLKYLNFEKPINFVKAIPKSQILKVYESRLQEQENEKGGKQKCITQAPFQCKETKSSNIEFPECSKIKVNLSVKNNENPNNQNVKRINCLEKLVQTYNNNKEKNQTVKSIEKNYNINQVNSEITRQKSFESDGNNADRSKVVLSQSARFANNETINSCKNLLIIPKVATSHETIMQKYLEVLPKSPQCSLTLTKTHPDRFNLTTIHKADRSIKTKPENVNSKMKKKSIQNSPRSSKNVDNNVNHHNTGVKEPATGIDSSTMKLLKGTKGNKNEMDKIVKTPERSLIINKPPSQAGDRTESSIKACIFGSNFRNSKLKTSSLFNKEGIIEENNLIKEDIVKNKEPLQSENRLENLKSYKLGIKVKSPKCTSLSSLCTNSEQKTSTVKDTVIKKELYNNRYNKQSTDVKKKITNENKLTDEVLLKNIRSKTAFFNELMLKDLNEAKENIDKRSATNGGLVNTNIFKGTEKSKKNEPKKNKSTTAYFHKEKMIKQDISRNSRNPRESLKIKKTSKSSLELNSEQKQAGEVKNFNSPVRNEYIDGNVSFNKKENILQACVSRVNENKINEGSATLKAVLANSKPKLYENVNLQTKLARKPDSNLVKSTKEKDNHKENSLGDSKNGLDVPSISKNLTEIKSSNPAKCSSRLKQIMILKTALKKEDSLNEFKRKKRGKYLLSNNARHPGKINYNNINNPTNTDSNKNAHFVKSYESLKHTDEVFKTEPDLVRPFLTEKPLVGKRKLNEQLIPEKKNVVPNSRDNCNDSPSNCSKMPIQPSKTSKGCKLSSSSLNKNSVEQIPVQTNYFSASKVKSSLSANLNKSILKSNPESTSNIANVPNAINMKSLVDKHISRDYIMKSPVLNLDKGRKLHSKKSGSSKIYLKKYGENKHIDLAGPEIRSLRSIQVVSKKGKNKKLIREEYSNLRIKSLQDNKKSSAHQSNIVLPAKIHTRNIFTMENKANIALNYTWKRYASTVSISKNIVIPVDAKRDFQVKSDHFTPKKYTITKSKTLENSKREGYKTEIKHNAPISKVQYRKSVNKGVRLNSNWISTKEIEDPSFPKLNEIKCDSKTKRYSQYGITKNRQELSPFSSSPPVNKPNDIEVLYQRQQAGSAVLEGNQRKRSEEKISIKPPLENEPNKISLQTKNSSTSIIKPCSENVNNYVLNSSKNSTRLPTQENCVANTIRTSNENNPALNKNTIIKSPFKHITDIKNNHLKIVDDHQHLPSTKHQQAQDITQKHSSIEKKCSDSLFKKSQTLKKDKGKHIVTAKSVDSIKEKTKNFEHSSTNLQKYNLSRNDTIANKHLKWKSKKDRLNIWIEDDILEEPTSKLHNTECIQAKKRTHIKSEKSINNKTDININNFKNGTEQSSINQTHQNQNENIFNALTVNKERVMSLERRQSSAQKGTQCDRKEKSSKFKPIFLGNEDKKINAVTKSSSILDPLPKIELNLNENAVKKSTTERKAEASESVEGNSNKDVSMQGSKTHTAKKPLNITGTTVNKKILIKRGEFKRNISNLDNFKKNHFKKMIHNLSKINEIRTGLLKGSDNSNPGSSLNDKTSTDSSKPTNKKNVTDINNNEFKNKSNDQTLSADIPSTNKSQSSHILKAVTKPLEKKNNYSIDIPNTTLKTNQNVLSLPKIKKEENECLKKNVNYYMNKSSKTLHRGLMQSMRLAKDSEIYQNLIPNKNSKTLQTSMIKGIEQNKSYGKNQKDKPATIKERLISNVKETILKLPQDLLRDRIEPIPLEESKQLSLTLDEINKLSSKVNKSGYKILIGRKSSQNTKKTAIFPIVRKLNDKYALNIQTKQKLRAVEKNKYYMEFPLKINMSVEKFPNNSITAKSDSILQNIKVKTLKNESDKTNSLNKLNTNQAKTDRIKSWKPRRNFTVVREFPKENIKIKV